MIIDPHVFSEIFEMLEDLAKQEKKPLKDEWKSLWNLALEEMREEERRREIEQNLGF